MRFIGAIRAAELQTDPADMDQVEMILHVQGVAPGQPRRLVVPFALLMSDPSLDPDDATGRRFDAEAAEDALGRFVVNRITLGIKVLRSRD
jgi:hypothetical protein